MKFKLKSLGANYVFTDEELVKNYKTLISELKGSNIKLGLNCVGGDTSTFMLRFLSDNAKFVTYGGMSRQPIKVPASYLIFKNVTFFGFWLTRWLEDPENYNKRTEMLNKIVDLYKKAHLKEPAHNKINFPQEIQDEHLPNDFLESISLRSKLKQIMIFQ